MMLESCRCTVRGVVAQMRFVDANSPMRPVLKADPPAEPTFFVFQCPEHGLHHFGPTTPLTAGPPLNSEWEVR
jgi:hypothetical protein